MNQLIQPAASVLALVDQTSGVGRRIRDALTSPSNNDRAIATVVLRDPFVAAFSTVEQVAAAAGVSKAAVARFGIRLGYSGYTELRQDLRTHWQERTEPIQKRLKPPSADAHSTGDTAGVRSLLNTRLAHEVESLSRLIDTVDPATLIRCADLLARRGTRIHVLGERRGYAVAVHALRTLRWVGCDARLFHLEETGLRLTLDELAPRHVLLTFAFRRYPRTSGVVLRQARERGVRSILITDSLDCPFIRDADEFLICATTGNLLIDSSVPAVFCFEALCDVVMQRLGDRVQRHVRRVHEQTRLADFDDADQTAQQLRSPRRARAARLRSAPE